MAGETPILELRGLSKQFGSVSALKDVDLSIARGEIHGLLGENGSGKSTLIKVLAGFHSPESGHLFIGGREVKLPLVPGAFRQYGLAFVHQDLGLIPSLSVLENLTIGEVCSGRYGWRIPWRTARIEARRTFADYGVELDPSAKVSDLRPVDRALLAIIRAAGEMKRDRDASDARGLLVLDEPTVFLPREDVNLLFALMREVVAGGDAVLFVSHDLDEVREITDRVTVLRDGSVVGTRAARAASTADLVELIIGRQLSSVGDGPDAAVADDVALAVTGLTTDTLSDVSFSVRRGEVLGLTGLVGSGFEDVPYALFGHTRRHAGRIALGGAILDVRHVTPVRALSHGFVLVPGDRQRDGAVGSLSITDNATLHVLRDFYNGIFLNRRQMRRRAEELMQRYDVRAAGADANYGSMSGGNQQKALLAKWMQTDPAYLLLHEPTQGVDIGARFEIFRLIGASVQQGMTVICASSDYEQLEAICNRVLIFRRGRIARELVGSEVTKDQITEQCLQSGNHETAEEFA